MKTVIFIVALLTISTAHAADPSDVEDTPKPARFQPWQRMWQCNDIRVTETVNRPGIVHYDLGGTIWGGSQFVLNLTNGALMSGMYRFRGRPRPAMGQIIRTSASAPGLRGEAQDRGRSLTILVLACRREDVPGGVSGAGLGTPSPSDNARPREGVPGSTGSWSGETSRGRRPAGEVRSA